MGYIYQRESMKDLVARDPVLSKRQAREDLLNAKTEGELDAQIFDKFTKFKVPQGFKRIPGASRSGALDPSTRSRFLSREQVGEIELARNQHGELIGYREVDTTRPDESPR